MAHPRGLDRLELIRFMQVARNLTVHHGALAYLLGINALPMDQGWSRLCLCAGQQTPDEQERRRAGELCDTCERVHLAPPTLPV